MNDEKSYLDSLFLGVSIDSAPLRDIFEKKFTAKTFNMSFENLHEKIKQACKKFNCSEEMFFMNAYALLLAKFSCAEEVLFSAESEKKFSVFLTFSSDLKISDSIKNLQEQIKNSRELIKISYEEIAENYNFHDLPEFIFASNNVGEKTFAMQIDENFLTAKIIFDGGKYSDTLIESFSATYKNILDQLLTAEKINDIEWLSAEELDKLKKIHDTDWKVADRPAYKILQDSAEKYPDRVAAIANGKSLTYSELNTAANRVGKILRDNGAGVEKIVGLILNRGLEVYIARQGILKSGGAFLAMTPDYPDERIKFIVEDAKVQHLITSREIYSERKEFFDSLNIFICFIEDIQNENIPCENLNISVPYNALAYCIYTSGSTGKPKGVMLMQKNLVNFVDGNPKNHEILGYTERGKVSLALAAITFDVSIMEEFIPLAHGLTICMANEDEIHNPLELKKLCDENKVDLMSCTPSYLANLIDLPEFESVIKRIKSVDFGAEAFPSALFTKLRAVNPEIYIMNGYGPTEATISCTMKAIESAENITIGFPNSNVKVVMTDEKNKPLPIGALGEMTIIGDGVGRGYINRDEQTKKVFINLWNKPAYKSGDLARLLPNGEIEFHGRTDNQVKLRGLRVELGEIETVMNNFDGIKSNIVLVKKNSAGDYLAGYFTAEKQIDLNELKKYLSEKLTAYMVPGVLMQLEKFPLTANRKIDKKSLPEPEENFVESVEIIPPQNEVQQKIFECVAEILNTKNFGVKTDFYSVGLTSIGLIRLNVLLSRSFNKIIRTKDIKEHSTIEQLEKFLLSAEENKNYDVQENYPLTQTQNGIFIECVANPDTTIYNIPCLYQIDKNIDVEKLRVAIKAVFDAHQYLKTNLFMNDDGDILAKRNDDAEVTVNLYYVEKLPTAEELVKPYELLNKSLYRAEIYICGEEKFLFLDLHHIICDGESFDIFLEDINAAYDGKILSKENYSGFEIALDEEKLRQGDGLAKAKNYFDSIFKGCDAECKLEKDFDATNKNFVAYERGNLKISVDSVKKFCAKNNLTFNAFFNAAFGLTLAKFLYRDNSVFTTIYNGRNDSRLANSVGMFVKTLPVSCTIDGEKNILEYVSEVGKQILTSMTNDIFSFAEIKREYGITSDVMFVYQGEAEPIKIAGEIAEEISLDLNKARSLFGMDISIKGGKFYFETEYNPKFYNSSTVKKFAECMSQVAEEFLTKEKISEVNILTAEELDKLKKIHDTDWKVAERPAYKILQDSAEKYPDRVAAIANGKSLTYSELNAAANRVGKILRDNGAGVEKIVGLILNRGLEVYIARQGILKSGGAFLAMTPDYPDERIKFIVEDAKVQHLITSREIYSERKEFFDSLNIFICFIEDIQNENIPCENLNISVPYNALAYCIYTSGSTGKPKGVMLTQKNLVNFVDGNPKNHEILGYTERGKVSLALAAITFDVSIMEEFIPLAHGLTICMANEEEIHNPLSLKKLCDENKVDLMSCTPSYLANLIDLPEFESVIKRIKSVDFGAEAFPSALFTKLRAVNPEIYIMNGYGPTEATISCTMKAIESAENITIGFPNSNVKVVMTDEKNRPLPIGALGEMTIIGDGVGRGYINRDEQTKKVFINLWNKPAYKSGDLARLLPNGEIEFHGRTDNQVKLRGLRVELGEIETVMNNFDGIKSSVVIVKKDDAGDYLAGYFTAEKQIDLNELKKHLSESLTTYMVPGVLMQLEKFPLTANRKIDKKSLPEPVLQVEETEIKIATTDLQKTLCEIFAKALGRKNIGADENFFEIGGTSLAASKVAMSAYLKNLPIVYADIFKYPTPEKLEQFILSKENSEPVKVEEKILPQKISAPKSSVKSFLDEVFQIENALAKNRAEFVDEIRHEGLGDVLLTGATGFLGIHVLYDLLKNTSAKIFAFVRGGKNISAEDRLKNLFVYYFNSSPEKIFDERITVIDGDITNVDSVNSLMTYPFKTLINCAACVKHFAADDILTKINVEGVQNLINLCENKKSRLIQISTVSIAGDNVDGKFSADVKLCEKDFYIGQEVTTNKYVYSKFQAEEIILSAIGQGKLNAKIMRVGNLMSRISDGEFQINFMTNAFMRDLRSYAVIGKFPVSKMDEPTEFSPIDETAKMLVELADTNKDFTVYHVVNSHLIQMGDIVHAMNEYGIKIEVVPDEIFNAALTEAMQDENKSLLVSNLIAYNEDENHTVKEIDHEDIFTIKALYRLNCRWSITDDEYIKNAIRALDTLGFFEGKLNSEHGN